MSKQNNEQTNWIENLVTKVGNWVADKIEDVVRLFGESAYNSFYPIGCDRRRESLNFIGLLCCLLVVAVIGGIRISEDMNRQQSAYSYKTATKIEKHVDNEVQAQAQPNKSEKVYLIEETDFDKWVCNFVGMKD